MRISITSRCASNADMDRTDPEPPFRGAYIGIGSNIGDRLAYLQLAVDALARVSGVRVTALSRVYETAPVGGPPQEAYLNAVVAIETNLVAEELLHHCQHIEALAARVRVERWGPRTLDVDILLVDGTTLDDPDLTIPHPRVWERGFVLAPLRDVAPELVDESTTWEGVRDAGLALSLPPLA
jgi:2-amino-4-hydroxy-6-hydroxymethyldihydropteridine diphosphokinase